MTSDAVTKSISGNEAAHSLAENPVGVFIGGTSGIGLHTAYAFAKYTPKPTIYIVGRNKEAGESALKHIKELNFSSTSYFLQHDLTLLKEVDEVVSTIKNKEKKINMLCATAGYLALSGRDETSEGLDKKMAINYYARWKAIVGLLPLVQVAQKSHEPARVINVLAPGTEGDLDMNDLDLKHNYGMRTVNRYFITMMSLATLRFARVYPDISFSHVHPGLVKTGILRSLPWWVRSIGSPMMYFGDSADDCAEKTLYEGYSGKEYSTGAHILDRNMGDVYEQKKQFLSVDTQDKVWKHTEDVFENATGK